MNSQPLISVKGEATLEVDPEIAVVNVTVMARDKDRHAVEARFDLQPHVRLGAAARRDDTFNSVVGRFFHDAQMARGGEGDALEHGAMEVREPVRRAKAKELRARVPMCAQTLARQIRHEE